MTIVSSLRKLPANRFLLGGAVVAGLLGVTMVSPSRVVWSDAQASVAKAPPRLALDPAAFASDDVVVADGVVVAPATMVSAHGLVRASEEAVLASRMTALITALPLDIGQRFAKGQTLVSFDCAQMKAQLAAAQASAAAYRKTYDTNAELDQYKAIGTAEVAVSRANLGKATAEAQAIQAGLSQCAIVAPFAGSVVERIAHPHDVAAPGQPLMRIQGANALDVEVIVPSNWVTWLRPGTAFSFGVDETGGTVTGHVTELGAAVDPVSKTIRVIGRIDPHAGVLPGMSGTAHFARAGDVGAA